MQGGVKRRITDRGRKLTMSKNIFSTVEGQIIGNMKNELTSITTNRTGEMRIDRTRKAVVAECVFAYTSRTEVLGREHASCRHDADKGVEGKFFGVLRRNLSFYFELLGLSVTHDAFVKRSSEGTRAGYIELHSLPLQ